MKITDYAILFMTILLSLCFIYEFKDNIAFRNAIYGEEVNRAVDNAVVKALEQGYISGSKKTIGFEMQKVSNTFIETASYLLYGNANDYSKVIIESKIISFILVDNDGYYSYSNGKWSEKNIFSSDLHERKVYEIEERIQQDMDNEIYRVLFPKNSGEIFAQTISDYSLLVVYETAAYEYDGNRYANCILSGAAVKNAS